MNFVRWDFCLFLFTAISSAPRTGLALADTQQIFVQWINGSGTCTSQGDASRFLSGECVGRAGCCREALSLPALRQVGMRSVCAKCSPVLPLRSSHSAFHGLSESALCTKVWLCFYSKAKKEIPHRKCLHTLISTLQFVLTWWRNSTELNTPLQSGTLPESPQANILEWVPLPFWITK